MDGIDAGATFTIVAQSIRDTGGEVDVTALLPWVITLLSGVVLVVSIWRLFKNYLEGGKDGKVVAAEERTKANFSILTDAAITIACIAVGATVIGFISQFVINKVG